MMSQNLSTELNGNYGVRTQVYVRTYLTSNTAKSDHLNVLQRSRQICIQHLSRCAWDRNNEINMNHERYRRQTGLR